MKDIILACVCISAGLCAGYFIWKGGDTSTPCTISNCCRLLNENPDSCRLVIPAPNTITPVDDTSTLRQAYRSYKRMMRPDSSGYSINRDLITYLNGQMQANANIVGFRLYPGAVGTQNKTIYIALVRNGSDSYYSESMNLSKGFQFNAEGLMGYTGPCPDWCDNNSRIIK
ncbi:MAG: hypothetical protein IPM92_16025 [Saprospiraceae bacterium]|nr:hypothetical protein [Saprospiraceae bacterium]